VTDDGDGIVTRDGDNAPKSVTRDAARAKEYRMRRCRGMRCFMVRLDDAEIESLTKRGYLEDPECARPPAAYAVTRHAASFCYSSESKVLHNYPQAPFALGKTFILNTSVSGLGAREVAMSIDFPRQRGAVIANIGTKETALQRYKSERDAAIAWVKPLQVSGVATKEDWLKFSERIRIAAERLLKDSANEPTSIAI